MGDRQPVFVLGMPRCRTAWLSLCLASLGVDCSHEGMRDHALFDEYAAELNSRLDRGPAGDSDPSLVLWLDDIIARWPGARFLVVHREEKGGREALVNAAPDYEQAIKASWPAYLTAFLTTCDFLRSKGPDVARFVSVDQLASNDVLLDAMEYLTGKRPGEIWAKRMQRLKVTSVVDPVECVLTPPTREPINFGDGISAIEAKGLTATEYLHSDFDLVNGWWEAHNGSSLLQATLPPFGVVVSNEGEPWAAIWAYEMYGVPVAELTFPVSRPGLSVADASRALLYGALVCMEMAGRIHVPAADYRTFKVVAPRPMIRFLKRLGFKEYLTERTPMMITL